MTVKRLITLVVIVGIIYGYKEWRARSEYSARHKAVAKEVSSVFEKAQVTVHACYPYEGFSYQDGMSPKRLVAVDVEFKNVGEDVDLDDIDIVDADKNENFGSDPDFFPLDEDTGTTFTRKQWPDLARFRMLLVYGIPQRVKKIDLSYWDKKLTYTPVAIDESAANRFEPPQKHIMGNLAVEKQIEEQYGKKVKRTTTYQ